MQVFLAFSCVCSCTCAMSAMMGSIRILTVMSKMEKMMLMGTTSARISTTRSHGIALRKSFAKKPSQISSVILVARSPATWLFRKIAGTILRDVAGVGSSSYLVGAGVSPNPEAAQYTPCPAYPHLASAWGVWCRVALWVLHKTVGIFPGRP